MLKQPTDVEPSEIVPASSEPVAMNKVSKKRRNKRKRGMTKERKILLKQQHLKREVDMGALNTERFHGTWRKIMMTVKIPEMRRDVEVIRNTFDHTLDIKDYCTSLTLECLDRCEEQHRRNIAQHTDTIKKFEGIYQDRLEGAHIFYEQYLESLMEQFETDVEKIQRLQEDDEAFLRAMTFEGKRRIETTLDNAISETVFKLENIRDDGQNTTRIAMFHLEEKVSSTWHHLNRILSKYLSDTQQRRASYEALKVKDARDREIIERQLVRTIELFDSIHKFRDRIAKLTDETDEKMSNIVAGKSSFYNSYTLMKERFYNEKKIDKSQLKILTTQYNVTMKHLQYLAKKAQTMLFLIRTCRKFQVHSEKILPVRLGEVNEEPDCLDFFWYRVGLAKVLMNDLRSEREILRRENDCLRGCLKCRLTDECTD